jgi:hypothetical protein
MVIWVMVLCSLVNGDKHLAGTSFLHYREEKVRRSVKPETVRSRVSATLGGCIPNYTVQHP